jgi:hypothetical protein
MRKSLWITLALLFVAIGAANARADSYIDGAITFTLSSGLAPTSGSFIWDNTSDSFKSFSVIWSGFTFDFTTTANTTSHVTSGGVCAGATDAIQNFNFMTTNGCDKTPTYLAGELFGIFEFDDFFPHPSDDYLAVTNLSAITTVSGQGGWSVAETAVAAPEPSSIALMLAGIGFLLVMRKRIGQGLPQAS